MSPFTRWKRIGGGQLGQFGNLGGQFGIQGGDQSQLLLSLIVETVAKGEWAQAPNAAADPGMDMELPQLTQKQLNSLGYYPPARALIIRGTSRYHPAATIKLQSADQGGLAVRNPAGGGAVVIGPGDLSMSMGIRNGWKDPRVQAEVTRIHAAARAAGKPAMIVALDHDDGRRLLSEGYQAVMVVTGSVIVKAARDFLHVLRS